MALYFNVIFAPIWMLIMTIILINTVNALITNHHYLISNKFQYGSYDELYRLVTITVIVSILIVEVLRLYLGYEGNLRDKVYKH